MSKYTSVVRWSEEDACYIATSPEFEHLSAFGDTQEEAIAELAVARELVIRVMEEDGQPIPEPQQVEDCSGQFRLRLPKSLHRRLAETARHEGVSLNTFVLSLLTEQHTVRQIARNCALARASVAVFASAPEFAAASWSAIPAQGAAVSFGKPPEQAAVFDLKSTESH